MKKVITALSLSLLIAGCNESDEEEGVEAENITTESNTIENLIITNGVNENGEIYGDSQDYANVYGESDSSKVSLIDAESGLVLSVTNVSNNEFYLSTNMQGAEERDVILTTDESVEIPIFEDIDSLENGINLKYIPNPNFEEQSSVSESEEVDDYEDYSTQETFAVGETAFYDSGLEIVVNSASLTDDRPHVGEIENYFVKVEFTIDNQTDEVFDFNGHYVELYDGGRNKGESDSLGWYSESIAPGMKSSGVVYFETLEDGPFTVIIGAATWESE